MARRGRRQTRGREWWFRLPGSPRPLVLRFPFPVSEGEARRRLRTILGYRQLPAGTLVTQQPLSEMKR